MQEPTPPRRSPSSSSSSNPRRSRSNSSGQQHAPPPVDKEHDKPFTTEEVAQHNGNNDNKGTIYVTHLDGVYDITDFVKLHPGGEMILQAAGKSVDPFWLVLPQHQKRHVLATLEELRIGTLTDYDPSKEPTVENPFAHEPENRSDKLTVYSQQPYVAGTVEAAIPLHYITPTELAYVRHNNAVPVEYPNYVLSLGWGIELSVDDLRDKFDSREITMTMICAGNRRDELNPVEPVTGLRWKSDGVSTAKWKGVPLSKLRAFVEDGTPEENARAKHVWFTGRDHPYDASIPIDKAFDDKGDVIIAYEMNGEPIPREHGGPVRAIVPGHVAARSVKWLESICADEEESPSYWQRGPAYKSMGPHIKKLEKLDFADLPSLQEMPVQSAICSYEWREDNGGGGGKPKPKGEKASAKLIMRGWAFSGGGRKVLRVDVSADGGYTWQAGRLGEGKDQVSHRAWAWTFWDAELDVSAAALKSDDMELVVRCCDESFNVQPESPKAVWNVRGNYNNSYHRVKLPDPRHEVVADATAAATEAGAKM